MPKLTRSQCERMWTFIECDFDIRQMRKMGFPNKNIYKELRAVVAKMIYENALPSFPKKDWNRSYYHKPHFLDLMKEYDIWDFWKMKEFKQEFIDAMEKMGRPQYGAITITREELHEIIDERVSLILEKKYA